HDLHCTISSSTKHAMKTKERARPNVIVLNPRLPRRSGLAILRKQMAEDPIPVEVCSGLTGAGTSAAISALGEGAVAIVTKAKLGVRDFLNDSALLLVDTIRGAAEARLAARRPFPPPRPPLPAPS